MSLPPIWKVKREIRRIRDQAMLASTNLYEPFFRWRHKKWLTEIVKPISGEIILGEKVAIFILFQPKGVAQSIYFTCDHLIAQGYSPFILSNAPLSNTDRTELLARSALLLERPNFGYDFGAYQDGIRLLDRLGCKPDRLILMNDSTWFPLRVNDTSIERMEASGDAFTGLIEKIEPDLRHHKGIDHLESHLLMFKGPALKCVPFAEFWKNYRASSNRTNTIVRGEKKISDTMFNAGFRSEGLLSRQKFLDRISLLSYDELLGILIEFCDVRADVTYPISTLIKKAHDTPKWREDAIRQLGELVFAQNYLLTTTFVFASMKYLGLGFVKKGHEKISHVTRQKVLNLGAARKIEPIDPAVRAEMEQTVANWTPKK